MNLFKRLFSRKKVLPVYRIDVLKAIKNNINCLVFFFNTGLCYELQKALYELTSYKVGYSYLSEVFPLFTRENALPFGARESGPYWWEIDRTAWKNGRRRFLDWLIEQYEHDTTDVRELIKTKKLHYDH